MGLFSFVKDAGAKLFSSKPEKEEKSIEVINAENASTLTRQINNLEMPIENLAIEINND